MAHLDEIRGLAEYHATRISSSPRDWMNYLDTAARLYQVSIYGSAFDPRTASKSNCLCFAGIME